MTPYILTLANRNVPICITSPKEAKASTMVTVACRCRRHYRVHYRANFCQWKHSFSSKVRITYSYIFCGFINDDSLLECFVKAQGCFYHHLSWLRDFSANDNSTNHRKDLLRQTVVELSQGRVVICQTF